jgi:hypothetical protein
MEDDDKDLLDMPFMTPDELRKFFSSRSRIYGSEPYRTEMHLAVAEITRRQTNEQIRLMGAQERQLEAQGEQIETQTTKLTRALARASLALVVVIVLLAVATLIPWIWPLT